MAEMTDREARIRTCDDGRATRPTERLVVAATAVTHARRGARIACRTWRKRRACRRAGDLASLRGELCACVPASTRSSSVGRDARIAGRIRRRVGVGIQWRVVRHEHVIRDHDDRVRQLGRVHHGIGWACVTRMEENAATAHGSDHKSARQQNQATHALSLCEHSRAWRGQRTYRGLATAPASRL